MLQIVDALPAQIALLDGDGNIVATNRPWSTVADQAGLGTGPGPEGRWNYLDECAAASGRACAEAGEIADGIRRVLDGRAPQFVQCYPCPFEGQHHWYQLAV